jgi:hypothetical protein
MTQVQREKIKLKEIFRKKRLRLEEEYNHLKSYLALSVGTALVIGMALGRFSK